MIRISLLSIAASMLCSLVFTAVVTAAAKPNIIFILADDLGYGDIQALNSENGKIPTPHIDQMAADGMIFSDAHTGSSVCTPSRYSILTGRYNWRSTLQVGVTWGFDPALIDEDRLTVAGFLREQGYNTACIGKWHIGMDLPSKNGKPTVGRVPKEVNVDWTGTIENGPVDVGFDYYWGLSASLDMAPYAYIENRHFIKGEALSEMTGRVLSAPGFSKEAALGDICDKTVEFISKQSEDEPFFIYVPLTSPHTPILPTEAWRGKSGLNSVFADFVMQTDAEVGKIIDAVDAAGFGENTIIIFTADNGVSGASKQGDLKAQGHLSSAQYRGMKKSIYEGGHRVPFIVRWPAGIPPKSQSDEAICLTDLLATCADLLNVELPDTAGEDSVSFFPVFSNKPIQSTRKGIVHHSYQGEFAYRSGKWKLLLTKVDSKKNSTDQLYNLEEDPSEKSNLYATHPEVVERLLSELKADVDRGRSTAGPNLKNDVAKVQLWKNEKIK
ncbi:MULTISPECIES: arylsulfatase [unclassified Lentimonas]|uniref:sulfatase family protein n=1 Tax=unclassified Lentimonas TaxID=2630993 RepID=UPI001FD44AE3|nr:MULTISPECIES: arylsulfatase [unclassified Lentimonas]